ncbi:hypothetical protein CTEN210_16847 [Chaetoceros tenuissimus]|uniref:PPM-type phosphatase domain-containing protein n=1 Tax=Chaetoceros tenuissimus TaxID=426638 RepID=A0AAD3D9I9_9STRA|nr:hypothetical protein CTEN210_16847 [Chaetoceros tenuissimus]
MRLRQHSHGSKGTTIESGETKDTDTFEGKKTNLMSQPFMKSFLKLGFISVTVLVVFLFVDSSNTTPSKVYDTYHNKNDERETVNAEGAVDDNNEKEEEEGARIGPGSDSMNVAILPDKSSARPLESFFQNVHGQKSDIYDYLLYGRKTLVGNFVYVCGEKRNTNLRSDTQTNEKENQLLCSIQGPVYEISDELEIDEATFFPEMKKPVFKSSTPKFSDHNDYAVITRRGFKGDEGSKCNQDRPFILHPPTAYGFIMGIIDGHGEDGHKVSHSILMDLIRAKMGMGDSKLDSDIVVNDEAALKQEWIELFRSMDTALPESISRTAGATGSFLSRIGNDNIVAVNTGDSRSMIVAYDAENGKPSNARIVYITQPHKGHLPEEARRVTSKGAQIIPPRNMNGVEISSRVIIPIPGFGNAYSLAMSRSFGDSYAKKVGVIVDPTVDVLKISELKEKYRSPTTELFAVSMSDGIFDHIKEAKIAEFLAEAMKKNDPSGLHAACQSLILQSSLHWMQFGLTIGQPYRDDISIAVHKIF